jgi:hypothetical protein
MGMQLPLQEGHNLGAFKRRVPRYTSETKMEEITEWKKSA